MRIDHFPISRLTLLAFFVGFLSLATAHAQISTDGTVGAKASLTGPDYRITADYGKQTGRNLFHSFNQFNINSGESATFAGPNSVSSIISRVTGGSGSWIDGILRSEIPNANLYLLNPAGVMFGPNASLDLGGSFHVSTADYLKLGEDGRFDALRPEDSVLTVAEPSAFGFVRENPAEISLEGSFLQLPEGKTLSVVGGDIRMHDSTLCSGGGQINAVSAMSSGEVLSDGQNMVAEGFERYGDISILREAEFRRVDENFYFGDIEASGLDENQNGGAVFIRGGRFFMKSGSIDANTRSNRDGGGILFRLSGNFELDGGNIECTTSQNGKAGDITIEAETISVRGGNNITIGSTGNGHGGNIAIHAGKSVEITGDESRIWALSTEGGDTGDITVSAPALNVENKGWILTAAQGTGRGGDINIEADQLSVSNGGKVLTPAFGTGHGGNINIIAKESVEIKGEGIPLNAGSPEGCGDAGSITISTATMKIDDNAMLTTSAFPGSMGSSGDITINADNVSVGNESSIMTTTAGEGNAGNISITANYSLDITGDSRIMANTNSKGTGGYVTITSPDLLLDNGSIEAASLGDGTGGTIRLNTANLALKRDSTITVNAKEKGDGGTIIVHAGESVSMSGDSVNQSFLANTFLDEDGGDGGNITIVTPSLEMKGAASIQAATQGSGNAGNITIETGTLKTIGGVEISSSASANSTGNGGNITVNASESVIISGHDENMRPGGIACNVDGPSNGGTISIKTPSLILDDHGAIQATTHGSGNAGNILLDVGSLAITGAGQIHNNTHNSGNSGSIAINAAEFVYIDGYVDDDGKKSSGILSRSDSSGSGGIITISTPSFRMDNNGSIEVTTTGSGNGGSINLTAENVSFENGSLLNAVTRGEGDGGNIKINAETVFMSGYIYFNEDQSYPSGLAADTYGGGNGGEIDLEVGTLVMEDSAQILAAARTGISGNVGKIKIIATDSILVKTDSMSIYGSSTLISCSAGGSGEGGIINIETPLLKMDMGIISSKTEGDGNAGKMQIKVGNLELANSSQINSGTDGSGQGAELDIEATEQIRIHGYHPQLGKSYPSAIFSQAEGSGNGGPINISTPSLILDDEGSISTNTEHTGNSGNIFINTTELTISKGGHIGASNLGSGNAGEIHINATKGIAITSDDKENLSAILSNSIDTEEGKAGKIVITTPDLVLDKGQIQSTTDGKEDGGDIIINVDNLTLRNVAQLQTTSEGSGKGGNITVNAKRSVRISGQDEEDYHSGFLADTEKETGGGEGGTITIVTPSLTLEDGGIIHSKTKGDGQAGKVILNVDNLVLAGSSEIATNSKGTGDGGELTIRAANSVYMDSDSMITAQTEQSDGGNIFIGANGHIYLTQSRITTSVQGGEGNGGNITIANPRAIALNNSNIIANAHGGDGGNIRITADHYIASARSIVSASSELGIDGEVHIESPEADISGALASLPSDFVDASKWMETECHKRTGEDVSRFALAQRDGIPGSPDDWLPSPPPSLQSDELANAAQKGGYENVVAVCERFLSDPNVDKKSQEYFNISICLASAWQHLGQYQKALSALKSIEPVLGNDSDRKALCLSFIGDLWLAAGITSDTAKHTSATDIRDPFVVASGWNNNGNLNAAMGRHLEAENAYDTCLDVIKSTKRAENEWDMVELESKALLNKARLAIQTDRPTQAGSLTKMASDRLWLLPDAREKASLLLSIAHIAQKIVEHSRKHKMTGYETEFENIALQSCSQAARIAEANGDQKTASLAHGGIGQILEAKNRFEEAEKWYAKAVFKAQQTYAPEIGYLWQWRLGRINKARKNFGKALKHYAASVETVGPIRNEFFNGYRDRKHRNLFEEAIRPVYIEYAELLMANAESVKDDGEKRELLTKARDTLEAMKNFELQDYFQDECVTALKAGMRELSAVPEDTAVLYPIVFENHSAVLLTLSDDLKCFRIPVGKELARHAGGFRKELESGGDSLYLAKKLYDWLIAPLEPEFAKRKITTLVIAPDGPLRTIPFAGLYDGERFLIEKYAVVTVPSMTLADSKGIGAEKNEAILNGLTKAVQGFAPLPNVAKELEEISLTTGGKVLKDENYTEKNLSAELEQREYNIVHMSTHGEFGNSPENTFLLAFDKKISMMDLEKMVKYGEFRKNSLELLTLSACQTALGDERAALGLGGIALKAGARSAVATLWRVKDEAAAMVMSEFYRQLKAGMPRGKALQEAQKKLIADTRYRNPGYWAPFLLIGNWM